MTGRQLKQFAEMIDDDAKVEFDLKGVMVRYHDEMQKLTYQQWPTEYYEDLPVELMRFVVYPPVVLAERAAKRLQGT